MNFCSNECMFPSKTFLTYHDIFIVCTLLLEKMNLNQYRDTFEVEHIDGIFLASLDNEMLEELGVTKSLHKLRLNKIIEGSKV